MMSTGDFEAGAPASGNATNEREPSILYLDDDPTDRKLFEISLSKLESDPYDLTCVASVDEAREVLAARSVDYFVTDNRLHPTTTFRDTLAALEDEAIEGKIIIISSETDSIFDTDVSDMVHSPDVIRDKFSFFSDLRKLGLGALHDLQPESFSNGLMQGDLHQARRTTVTLRL